MNVGASYRGTYRFSRSQGSDDRWRGMITCRPLRANGQQLYHPHFISEIFDAPASVMWRRRCNQLVSPRGTCRMPFAILCFQPVIYIRKLGFGCRRPQSPNRRLHLSPEGFIPGFLFRICFQMTIASLIGAEIGEKNWKYSAST